MMLQEEAINIWSVEIKLAVWSVVWPNAGSMTNGETDAAWLWKIKLHIRYSWHKWQKMTLHISYRWQELHKTELYVTYRLRTFKESSTGHVLSHMKKNLVCFNCSIHVSSTGTQTFWNAVPCQWDGGSQHSFIMLGADWCRPMSCSGTRPNCTLQGSSLRTCQTWHQEFHLVKKIFSLHFIPPNFLETSTKIFPLTLFHQLTWKEVLTWWLCNGDLHTGLWLTPHSNKSGTQGHTQDSEQGVEKNIRI